MADAAALVDDLFRQEAGKIAAWLARLLGPSRLALIEDSLQDAFGTALARWPHEGVPDRPAAWLAVAARNKALDRLRAEARHQPLDEGAAWRLGFADPTSTGGLDDTLALMFVACHPALPRDEQIMLTLQTVSGFGAREIARAFLMNTDAVHQRLSRAKRRIRDLNLTFEIPEGAELARRLPVLIDAIYLLFNGGYTAGDGEALMTPTLCAEAVRLAGLLTEHPRTATGDAHALAALLCLHHARAEARMAPAGDLVLLADQDRNLWDGALVVRGYRHLEAATSATTLTPIHLEAAIAAVHAAAPRFAETDWTMVARNYRHLEALKPTPIVRLNSAIALAYAAGPAEGLARLDELGHEAKLQRYALYHAARGEMLHRLGRDEAARDAFTSALACPVNDAERVHLRMRLAACTDGSPPS